MRDPSDVRTPADIGSLAGTTDQIYILPVGVGRPRPGGDDAQVENLRAILDSVKRTYNVDENRVTALRRVRRRHRRVLRRDGGHDAVLRASCHSTASSWSFATSASSKAISFRTTCAPSPGTS